MLDPVKVERAEAEIDKFIIEGRDYEGKAEDLARVQRKQRELGPDRLRRALGGGGVR